MAVMDITGNRLYWQQDTEKILIEPWGKDGLRVRVTRNGSFDGKDWTLENPHTVPQAKVEIYETAPPNFAQDAARLGQGEYQFNEKPEKKPNAMRIVNGGITAEIDRHGYIRFLNGKGEELVREYVRNRSDLSEFCVPLSRKARLLTPVLGSEDWRAEVSFEAYEGERFYGLGQYQEDFLNLKGCTLELAQRNSQASIPFMLSSRGYGFLWNNPAVGNVTLGENVTEWTAERTRQIDYWITAADTPAQILENYTAVTGRVPMMRRDLMGFWQCKLRYQTQDEVLRVVREHKKRGLPMDVIVIDFFHWTAQGDWQFDPRDFPDPKAMVDELKELGVNLMVSIWPTVDQRTDNYKKMSECGYLMHMDRGMPIHGTWMGPCTYYDAINPGARKFVWDCAKKNYYDLGIKLFWLDEAEPEINAYDADNYRYFDGPALLCANEYPKCYIQGFYEGMKEQGDEDICHLIRCAWAGSQKYGALLWSGDVESTFTAMRKQLSAGLNAGMAGIPWWTCDIGGFLGGFTAHKDFRELLVRWFQMGAFLPVMRLHGDRLPYTEPPVKYYGQVERFGTGAGNEVWSFGEDNYEILKKYILIRESLKPYIEKLMAEAHEKGTPVIRATFFQYPDDPDAPKAEDQYLFGSDLLVAPVFAAGAQERSVYLPKGDAWREVATGKTYEGGQTVTAKAPIDVIPLFVRAGADLPL